MLNKTSAYIGLVVATAAGALLANSPANAQVDLLSGSHHHHSYHHRSHNRNWNGNHNRPRIFIRIYIYNKNNNRAIAIARPERGRSSPVIRTWNRDPGDAGAVAPAAAPNQDAAPELRPVSRDEGVTPTSTGADGQTAPRDNPGAGGGRRDESYSDGTPTS